MVAGSTSTTLKTAFPGASLLAAIWTEYFLQERNMQPVRAHWLSINRRQSFITLLETGNKILLSEGTSVFNVDMYCETKQFCRILPSRLKYYVVLKHCLPNGAPWNTRVP